jgi:hypothetical protein
MSEGGGKMVDWLVEKAFFTFGTKSKVSEMRWKVVNRVIKPAG